MTPLLSERRKDRLATVLIRAGGVLVILVVVAIVVNIGAEALPLFRSADQGQVERVPTAGDTVLAGCDPRREIVWVLDRDGTFRFRAEDDAEEISLAGDAVTLVAADQEIHGLVAAITAEGSVMVGRLRFRDVWSESKRRTTARWRASAEPLELGIADWVGVTANTDEDGNLLLAAWDRSGGLMVAAWDAEDEVWAERSIVSPPTGVDTVAVAENLANMAYVDREGALRVLRSPGLDRATVLGIEAAVAEVRFLIGGGTLVAAGRDGSVSILLETPRVNVENHSGKPVRVAGQTIEPGESAVVPDDEVGRRLASRSEVILRTLPSKWQVVRRLTPMEAEPTVIAPAHRRRGFAIGSSAGEVAVYHSTSGRRLLADRWSADPVHALAIDPKGDGAVSIVGQMVLRRWIHNPHPEISLRTLFLPVWYEGYAAPKWVWQSTGGSDAFEPKLSLWPLIFGTLKATLFAMLFSIPLALMASIYVSQLAPRWLQAVVKPTIEMMAAVPSVVVGFIAALWLAPRLEAALLAVLLGAVALPLAVVIALATWRLIPADLRRRFPDGVELVALMIAGGAVVAFAALLAGPIEVRFFGGDFQRFLFTEWGLRYEQRNSIVVGLALGFAVIPVIFTIAEDACSAVPRALVNASRALGATRWQTALRLVVPAASPGIFAAVMLGLGRAVGETMIVLMAAGNTPLLDLSLFNGMRTMSAAIAVEIPEAPVDGTLFRLLFLTGALLFLFTLMLTTAADVVGSHLRKRYARF
ncbi:MAG: ABC transporter permease subunit [Thermoanaerobaculales bacterium]